MIRVLVVDDSSTHRSLLTAVLQSDPGICVVGTAADGAEALRKVQSLRPDLVTMDLQMPVMDGFEATRRIMEVCPTPIVVVAANACGPNSTASFQALRAGALEVVAKPIGQGQVHFEPIREQLLNSVRLMSEVKVLRRRSGDSRPGSSQELAARPPAGVPAPAARPSSGAGVVVVGASTGGPPALRTLLRGLPAPFGLPIVVVQHMTPGFTRALIDWLAGEVPLPVQLAADGELIRPGRVYFAPEGRHLEFAARGRLRLNDDPPVSFVKPSATILLGSAAAVYGPDAVGVILTGMGDDGALGLKAIRNRGGLTLVQEESSCVVYGMPRVAIELGAADRILPLAEIARALRSRAEMAGAPGPRV